MNRYTWGYITLDISENANLNWTNKMKVVLFEWILPGHEQILESKPLSLKQDKPVIGLKKPVDQKFKGKSNQRFFSGTFHF